MSSATVMSIIRGITAPASLKLPGGSCRIPHSQGIIRGITAPASLKLDLLGGFLGALDDIIRGITAPASLKLHGLLDLRAALGDYPGHYCPGLIEATVPIVAAWPC